VAAVVAVCSDVVAALLLVGYLLVAWFTKLVFFPLRLDRPPMPLHGLPQSGQITVPPEDVAIEHNCERAHADSSAHTEPVFFGAVWVMALTASHTAASIQREENGRKKHHDDVYYERF
jgi:hypothetical protein